LRASTYMAQAARNALAVGAYEDVLRVVENELMLLPADRTKERAAALAMRGDAYSGLGRAEDARSAWGVAAQRFEDAGDKRSASSIRSRLQAPVAAPAEAPTAEVIEPSGDAHEAAPAADAQATSLAANGTGA
jgi:hypothetical protein